MSRMQKQKRKKLRLQLVIFKYFISYNFALEKSAQDIVEELNTAWYW